MSLSAPDNSTEPSLMLSLLLFSLVSRLHDVNLIRKEQQNALPSESNTTQNQKYKITELIKKYFNFKPTKNNNEGNEDSTPL